MPLPLLLIGGSAVAAALLARRGKPRTSSGPAQLPATSGSASGVEGNTAAAIGAGATLAGVGGAIVGGATVLAAEAGRELDRLLGGDGTGVTGTIAAVATGGTVLVAGSVLLAGATLTVGLLLGAAVLVVGALVYGIASAWTDLQRLSYGRAGALADYEAEWERVYASALRQIGVTFPESTETDLRRAAIAYADGMMQERNRLEWQQWMRRPRGLGVTTFEHGVFGEERGYFCGHMFESGTFGGAPVWKSRTPLYEALTVGDASVVTETSVETVLRNPLTAEAQRRLLLADPDYSYEPIWETITTRTVSDPKRDSFVAAGRHHANVAAYLRHMLDARGLFQSAASHARAGLAAGKFDGLIEGTGDEAILFTNGQRFDWRDYQGRA
jgi:hypothetical protein